MYPNKTSANKQSKNAQNTPKNVPSISANMVPPLLKNVGQLAASVAAVSTSNSMTSGSATGNPRNKCALQPGHSLMDWIRLGSSGKDLTGVGNEAGRMAVTRQELAKHNKETDAWISIRGKVFNITHYLPFHPGGEEVLMKGAGTDATNLFNEVHAWVNYEQILQKCHIGRLVATDPSIDVENLFFGEKSSKSNTTASTRPSSDTRLLVSPTISKESPSKESRIEEITLDQVNTLPRFDWIQKTNYITIIFYTKAFCNPLVEIQPPDAEKTLNISLTYDDVVFKNEIVLFDDIIWPCSTRVYCETGKVEFVFKKCFGQIWEKYGALRQQSKAISGLTPRFNYIIHKKVQINHNIFLLKLERKDETKVIIPIGKHVKVYGNINGEELSRSYTPVPDNILSQFTNNNTTDTLNLMVKKYEDGNISKFITNSRIGDLVEVSKPLGNFDLKNFDKREIFLLLAAGTGITPMLGIICFLLERRIKKCQFLRLLFFNKTKNDIPFKLEFDKLEQNDTRFKVDHILSEPNSDWTGLSGHVSKEIISNPIEEYVKNTGYTIKDIFACVCGPNQFVSKSFELLTEVGFSDEQIHKFQG